MSSIAIGVAGLAAMIVLIVVRIPIAYAMILVGGFGTTILSGPRVVLSQLKDLAYAQFSIYDLSVLPMFVLMGALAARSGLSADLFRAGRAWLGRFRHMGLTVLLVQVAFGAAIVAFAFTRIFWLNNVLLFLCGAGLLIVFSMTSSLVQLIVPDHLRGRVVSIYMVAFRGGMPLGSLTGGWVANMTSAPTVLVINGVLLSCVAVWFLLRKQGVREL